jgi:hypothetical protein
VKRSLLRNTALVAGIAVLLALVVSGCGGEKQTASEHWADDVCTSINTWRAGVDDIRQDVTDAFRNGTLDEGELYSAFERASADTKQLVQELRQAGPPESDAGGKATKRLDETLTRVTALLDSARTKAEKADSLPMAVLAAGPDLKRAASEAAAGVDQISELKSALESTDSCRALRS